MKESGKLDDDKPLSSAGGPVPPGAQNANLLEPGSGTTVISGNGPFSIWLSYQNNGAATKFNQTIDNGPTQRLQPGTYPKISAKDKVVFQWQLDPGQSAKLGWIFLSGC